MQFSSWMNRVSPCILWRRETSPNSSTTSLGQTRSSTLPTRRSSSMLIVSIGLERSTWRPMEPRRRHLIYASVAAIKRKVAHPMPFTLP